MTKEWEKPEDLRRRKPVLWLTMTALFMAMVVVLSMSALSIPVPGGHLYFNDVVKLNVQKLTLCGVMAALVFVMTYFPKIPVPVTGGYVHLGDGAIFLSVLLLGPLGIPAAAVGSMLSDLIGGYMVYVLPTFLIKGLVALVAWKLCRKDQPLLALLSFLLAEAVMVLGYFLLEWALYGVASAAAAIGPNVVQGIAGVLIGMLCLLITPRLERVAKL